MGARPSKASFSVGEQQSGAQNRTKEVESEEEMSSGLPVGWDKAQNALCSKRWDHLVSLYEQPLREQPGNVFIVSLHGSLNPVHWDHIRMFEAAKTIFEKKVEGSIVIGAVRIIRDERLSFSLLPSLSLSLSTT